MNVLEKIENLWRQGREIAVSAIPTEDITIQSIENVDISKLVEVHDVHIEFVDLGKEEDTQNMDNQVISNIKLPPKIKVKGRPKGAEQTVIGLKRRRRK
ncbi:unnamed protein product [Acanthoscelides obtectus]|uniref:Uncharacterized protein n=1 Tax=Acanthoscelides obtectus TaxID=200917 RepID=A0A9P0M594_ACAOB|nr:unnamed protein product [Acanthoscelides obtectus]CAK1688214.1 hypothetical protein AOBTE_LOCUS36614 [Acanthoscelides obtectus]